MSTHLGNGLPAMLPKLDNPLMAQLAEDRLAAGFIADGVHVPVAALKVMLRAKGWGRSVLVTDAVAAAGRRRVVRVRRDGDRGGGGRVGAQRGAGRWPGRRCGSIRRWAIWCAWGLCELAQAVALAADNPARLLGRPTRGEVDWDRAGAVLGCRLEGMQRGRRDDQNTPQTVWLTMPTELWLKRRR